MKDVGGVTVAQLIEALRHMPQDAIVRTYAQGHVTGFGSNSPMSVAHVQTEYTDGRTAVLIGNWTVGGMSTWAPRVLGEVHHFDACDWRPPDPPGRFTVRHEPKRAVERITMVKLDERWSLEPVHSPPADPTRA